MASPLYPQVSIARIVLQVLILSYRWDLLDLMQRSSPTVKCLQSLEALA